MIPKQAIEKAIEGGYTEAWIKDGDVYTEHPHSSIVLQATFWQALFPGTRDWLFNAHRFYDIILTGGSTDEFWATLLT